MQGPGENLNWTSKVHEVEAGMQGKQNLDRLVCHCGRLCTHLDDLIDVLW